jgi:hypothetical protein
MRQMMILSLIFVFAALTPSIAQTGNWGLGPHLFISLPQEGFDNLTKDGEGLGGKAFYRFNNRFLSLRGDFAYISYGERREAEMVNIGGGIITRRNESFQFTLGPQFTLRTGIVTTYLAAMGGMYNYRTVTTVDSYYLYYPYNETTNSQTKWGYNGSAGLLFDLGIGPHIDLGFKYQRILDVKTNTETGSYKQNGTDFVITLGVVFFMR